MKPIHSSLFLALAIPASAAVTIDWVSVGDAGNQNNTIFPRGAVAYSYNISRFEVTNSQYAEFLNSKAASDPYGLYNPNMEAFGIVRAGSSGAFSYSVAGGLGNRPVVYISWFDAARFCNWLANGQGNSSTETGSYALNGATSGVINRSPGATIAIPDANEWYKAAFYNGTSQTYSQYPNGQSSITASDANYYSASGTIGHSIDVGSYPGDPSYYGTFDQGGNVYEWLNDPYGDSRQVAGGAWNYGAYSLSSSGAIWIGGILQTADVDFVGLRLVDVSPIPEPTPAFLTLLSAATLLRRKRPRS